MKAFRSSIVVSIVCMLGAGYWGFSHGGTNAALMAMLLAGILSVMEVSLSFDNAVVNASVLKDMDVFWRKMFMTVGMLIAVFGMRLVFPIAIVAVATSAGMVDVFQMALNQPKEYAAQLTKHHLEIATFGGTFLLLVFLNFIFDQEKEHHWLGELEAKLARLGKIEAVSILVTLLLLCGLLSQLPNKEEQLLALLSGILGIILYVAVDGLGALFESEETADIVTGAVKRAGFASFMYLEVLDASFSFDGVIGAFAISNDIVIIMLGLTIGAMFVRSLTIFLVEKGTLDNYIYLEHGAHYAIGALALIMFASTLHHIPEAITGIIGVLFIVVSLWSSVLYNKKQAIVE